MKNMTLNAVVISLFAVFFAAFSAAAHAEEGHSSQHGNSPTGVVNINTATPGQIAELPGVGPSLAARIVERRAQKPFEAADELKTVKGVGEKKFKELSRFIAVSGATTFRLGDQEKKGTKKPSKRENVDFPKEEKQPQAIHLPASGTAHYALI